MSSAMLLESCSKCFDSPVYELAIKELSGTHVVVAWLT